MSEPSKKNQDQPPQSGSQKQRILLQLDTDSKASSFDSIVGIDSGADMLLRYQNVQPGEVESIVHGAMFTRGVKDLSATAIFVGGGRVDEAELVFETVTKTFFGPLKVSVMLDGAGANTTAAAAVLAVERNLELTGRSIAVLGATGSVGQRICQLLGRCGAHVHLVSRDGQRAESLRDDLQANEASSSFAGHECRDSAAVAELLGEMDGVFAAGAAGKQFMDADAMTSLEQLQFAVDLNAVPPAGLGLVEATDLNERRGSIACFGPIGVGGLKMKIHRRCVAMLFESNDRLLNLPEIYQVGREVA